VRAGRALAALLGAACGAAFAQSAGGDFTVPRAVIGAGTARAGGGDFTVTASAGQPDAGAAMEGGDFGVQGGYWPQAAAPLAPQIFRNGFE